MTENTETAAPVKRTRKSKSFDERRAELRKQLADLEAKKSRQELDERIASGECADPEGAKKIVRDVRYLAAARSAMAEYGIATDAEINTVMDALDAALKVAVNGAN